MAIPAFVREDLEKLGLAQDDATLERLEAFLDRLLEANQRTNLTAVREPDAAWSRMIIDSLTVLPGLDGLPEDAQLIDVGTGGGLPGVPLTITKPDIKITLLEATGKKCAFLQDVVEGLNLVNVRVHHGRAEAAGQDRAFRERYDLAVCRAVGPMPVLLELCLPLIKVGGRLLAMKGPRVEEELDASGDAITKLGAGEIAVIDAYPQDFDNDLVIVSVYKDTQTPKAYPRAAGLPKKQPL
ncbi:MAG: 16S rRNA (guanine(527)-N(7))-methyltransferase RsmG [Planctomycetota bacterium]